MASRPVFLPTSHGPELVRTRALDFGWNPGFAPSQKKKNVAALHRAAADAGLAPLLEVSTKSEHGLGQAFSAFRLFVLHEELGRILLECAYQGSKQFEGGGPFTDLYSLPPKEARRDPRLRASGQLLSFEFEDFHWPLVPRFAFYDWLFIRAVVDTGMDPSLLTEFSGFTDIEFNPSKSLNTQAHAAALVVALAARDELWAAARSPSAFLRAMGVSEGEARPMRQGDLFS